MFLDQWLLVARLSGSTCLVLGHEASWKGLPLQEFEAGPPHRCPLALLVTRCAAGILLGHDERLEEDESGQFNLWAHWACHFNTSDEEPQL